MVKTVMLTTFLYFAYGSNLLKTRICINNPSAEFLGAGRLDGYQLDFIKHNKRWGGCGATIVPTVGAHVWGAVWRLNNTDLASLDEQEKVPTKTYFAKIVDISMAEKKIVKCRTYQQTKNPPSRKIGEPMPKERRPSKTYLEVVVAGAQECQLPVDYVEKLKKIPKNTPVQ